MEKDIKMRIWLLPGADIVRTEVGGDEAVVGGHKFLLYLFVLALGDVCPQVGGD